MHRLTLAEVVGDVPLNWAELELIEMCALGEDAHFGDEVPTEGADDNSIRAELIRHIMLDGCDGVKVHAKGVQIAGAWITGVLDLESCETPLDLVLAWCKICEVPVLRDARLGSVMLPGCHVPGITAQRLKVVRTIVLGQGFRSTGRVDLAGADIGGQLACSDGTFGGADGVALNCDTMTVGVSVFLRGKFKATGQVNLRGAQITRQLDCSGGTFGGAGDVALNCDAMTVGADVFLSDDFTATGQVNLRGAQIIGQLDCGGGTFDRDISAAEIKVGAGFFWRDVKQVPEMVDLTDAHVGTLRDDVGSWDGCVPVLDGFRYERIIGDMSVAERLTWLAGKREVKIKAGLLVEGEPLPWVKGVGRVKFDSQPYSQLAKVLREQGNASGSARVLVVREKLQRRAAYWRAQAGLDGSNSAGVLSVLGALKRPFDWVFGLVFGYGHQPARALVLVAGILVVCFRLYGAAYDAGQMAPNSDVVLTSAEWQAAADAGCATEKAAECEMPLQLWLASNTAMDYETFNRGLYALDLFVPLDALGQENAWAPSKDRGNLGKAAYYLRWVVQMLGWIITAVAAAALTGVIGRKE